MSNKRKLFHFAEIKTFSNVTEVGYKEVLNKTHPLRGKWNEMVFKNDHDIVLELGCGKGEYSLGMSRRYPNKNFIGMDIKGSRIWRGARTALDESMENVHFLRCRIDFLESMFSTDEVSEIWLTFPDPQAPKSKERKRLTSNRFLDKYLGVLKKGGHLTLKTDSDFLYEYSLEVMKSRGHKIEVASPDIYAEMEKFGFGEIEKQVLSIRTFYEKMFVEKGHKISYIKISV